MNLGLLRRIPALNQQPLPEPIGQIRFWVLLMGTIHQPIHQLMGNHREINVSFGMTGKTEHALKPLKGCSDTVPAKFIGIAVAPSDWTTPLQPTLAQDLQSCGEICFTSDTAAIRSEQNLLSDV